MTQNPESQTEQMALLAGGGAGSKPEAKASRHTGPVAAVRPLLAVPHLDRDFEYSIPEDLVKDVSVGVAVKVRFGGQDVSGYVTAVRDEAEHMGELRPLRRVVSPERVLTSEIYAMSERLAAQDAGTVSDVLRLAIPPRHAAAEKALDERLRQAREQASEPERRSVGTSSGVVGSDGDGSGVPSPGHEGEENRGAARESVWAQYAGGSALRTHIESGDGPGASWCAAPGLFGSSDWPSAVAELVEAARASGRGSLIVLPDARDVDRVVQACLDRLGPGSELAHQIVRLSADQGPQARYTAFLKTLRGVADVVVGTRAAMFAPVQNLGLALWWDDTDSLHAEPRAPYPHVRDVLRIRAEQTGAALVSAGYTRSAQVQQWVNEGVLRPVHPIERTSARVVITGDDRDVERHGAAARARIPAQAWSGARKALAQGPVLVQVPRRGYVPALACSRCRTKASCKVCHGPLGLDDGQSAPVCRWCGHVAHVVTCRECGSREIRALSIGAGRTAEELGRAFPGVPIRRSGAPDVLATVPDEPALVIATPGAEPVPQSGYAAAILLDAWALLDRAGLDAGSRALDQWSTAAALVRPAASGGAVFVAGVPRHTPFPAVEALVRWAPGWFAEREDAERREVGLPPVTRMAALEGPRKSAESAAIAVEEQAQRQEIELDVLGPLPLGRRHSFDQGNSRTSEATEEPQMRYLVRWPDPSDRAVPAMLRQLRATRSAAREPAVTVRTDPPLDGLG